jgi:hypothetical protein
MSASSHTSDVRKVPQQKSALGDTFLQVEGTRDAVASLI